MTLNQPSQKVNKQVQLWKDSYPWSKCIWELSYLTFSMILWYRLLQSTVQLHLGPLPVLFGFVVANFLVDFVSGVMHWAADTWGTFETPIFGPTIIRAFRMHHIDPQDIVKHSFAQTNFSSSYPAPFVIAIAFLTNNGGYISQTFNWSVIFGVVLGILTNEFHKWAHMVHSKPHPFIRFLQQSGLIISHEKHHVHHQGKFDSSYCIINGWMNPFLERINFWRNLQELITKYTGYKARVDDEYWRGLKEVEQ